MVASAGIAGPYARQGFLGCTKETKSVLCMAHDALGMRGYRSRNKDGELRDKRDDTHMGTIEKQYGRDFNVRSDMQLGTFLEKHGIKSLNDLITKQ